MPPMPANKDLHVLFAHVAYEFAEPFRARNTGMTFDVARSYDELKSKLPDADVLSVSMMWRNDLAPIAKRLKLIQSISAGTDQYDRAVLKEQGIRLASGQGVNANAVAEHAIALMLSLSRQLHFLRDHQHDGHWRPMQGDRRIREDEIEGKTVLIVGLGGIGQRLAALCKAFGMKVLATRRDPSKGAGGADEIHADKDLIGLLPRADFVALTTALTPDTTGLIGREQLAAMKPTAFLVNVARGKVCDELALTAALSARLIAGAALDVTAEEPLAKESPLWAMPRVIITPHSAGETVRYEDRVIDLLIENVGRLQRGETSLANGIV
ncbi:MAG: D-2-hydroxyacid dehydrogenase [Hyphomicrobiaceae bacterium]|nr:D-2-hydroxyacid dehydrogenase [Hyphomicrobiaceae bacterium]